MSKAPRTGSHRELSSRLTAAPGRSAFLTATRAPGRYPALLREHGQAIPTSHNRGRRQTGVRHVDLPRGKTLEDLFDSNPGLEASQSRTQAVVSAHSET